MGTITLDVSAKTNQPPNRTGWLSLYLTHGQLHVFTLANFTTETEPAYSDPEEDAFKAIKIQYLPLEGGLKLNGVAVLIGDEIPATSLNAGLLTYQADVLNANGYTDGYMRFFVSDVGSSAFSIKPGAVTFVVRSNINKAPTSVGDGEAEITLGNTFVFTEESLTSSLNPPYLDPESNPPYKLLIVSVPLFGKLELSGVTVIDGQEIDWADVVAGNFSYKSESFPNGDLEGFEFKISDTGSQQYIG
tara:strand:- start:8462 stop:9199 length:738 start_codon:yes stop_codon:yes gene_type:complete